MITVHAPLAGTVHPLRELKDPVFAQEIVGPGIVVAPQEIQQVTAVSPVAGTVFKIQPHAFVITTDSGSAILVHLGTDTVLLHGKGFRILVSEGSHVSVGDPITEWDMSIAKKAGFDHHVAVIALQIGPDHLHPLQPVGTPVLATDPILDIN